jgi:hypothetical protein
VRKRLPTLRPLPETLVSAVPCLQKSFEAQCAEDPLQHVDAQDSRCGTA